MRYYFVVSKSGTKHPFWFIKPMTPQLTLGAGSENAGKFTKS
jgi:hypothetical protein